MNNYDKYYKKVNNSCYLVWKNLMSMNLLIIKLILCFKCTNILMAQF